jgi:fatty acid desaturase
MLTSNQFKELTKTSTLKTLLDLTQCWSVILGSLYLCHLSYFFIPIAGLLIASRLHALTLIMHDGAHYLLSKNPYLNDFLSNMFCSFPLMLSTEVYRKTHLKHHHHTQTMKDPNYVIMKREPAWQYPKSEGEVKDSLIKDLFFLRIKDHLIIVKDWQFLPNFKLTTTWEKILFPIYLGAVLTLTMKLHLWPEFFIFQFSALLVNPFTRVRAMSEHVHRESKGQSKMHKLEETPTINANWLERFFIAPFNTNRHLEHHLYPTIPYYHLEKTHRIIKGSELYRAHCAYELDGYFFGERTSFKEVLTFRKIDQKEKVAA